MAGEETSARITADTPIGICLLLATEQDTPDTDKQRSISQPPATAVAAPCAFFTGIDWLSVPPPIR